jgi:hypothetical protein
LRPSLKPGNGMETGKKTGEKSGKCWKRKKIKMQNIEKKEGN